MKRGQEMSQSMDPPLTPGGPSSPPPKAKEIHILNRVIYSGLSGAIATTCIYPIDIVKTKLQDQKSGAGKTMRFKGPVDCFTKLLKTEGIKGLYRGWPPNVVLVMPEKALKLTLNDLFRAKLGDDGSGNMPLGAQMLAGGMAGFCQVAATNPMELLKIQGATMRDKLKKGKIKALTPYTTLARELSITGLYTGVVATLARDVPFSMVYFTGYAMGKDRVCNVIGKERQGLGAFLAGAMAGTLAAAITTPVDVIKTRVHSNATPDKIPGTLPEVVAEFGRREIQLIRTNTQRILAKEGKGAFFKGVVPRCLIISPLFAITMTCYEGFKGFFHPAAPL